MSERPLIRIRVLALVIVLVAGLFVSRLFFLQIIQGDEFSNQADRQFYHPAGALFNRGSIFFSWKDDTLFGAATVKQGYWVEIQPPLVDNAESLYQILSTFIPLDHDDFIFKISDKNNSYETVANHLPESTATAITTLKLPGVLVAKERWRNYSGERLGSHVLGFMAFRGNDYAGRYGLERQYESVLARVQNGSFVNFFAEIFLGLKDSLTKDNEQVAGDIITTIEPKVQTMLESEIALVREKWQSELVGGIVMDPKTGAIIALAASPDFNPGGKPESLEVLRNPLVSQVYEMGSIVKPLTIAAAIDSGVLKPTTTYTDYTGFVTINGRTIRNFDGKGRGIVSMQEVLNQSLNTGMVFVMQKMGKEKFRDYMFSYGIKDPTGIDLPDEAVGLAQNLYSSRDVEYATASFGQGVAWSPIAITRALASLGNGGLLVKPHLVKSVRYQTGLTNKVAPPPEVRVLQPDTSEEITRMLINVVDKALAGGIYKMPHHSVAAKTGTAQINNPETGGYYDDRYLHSFFGYFPAYDPKFIVFLLQVNPIGAEYASVTLTEPFMNLTKFLIQYYAIAPDR
ncbi:MAG: penicillin-binding protein 2 [Candidatus Vogelbacteria bacterium]|nr:penicillin-binding protein 2 [Candidatus Vogelbacteria bacterium]